MTLSASWKPIACIQSRIYRRHTLRCPSLYALESDYDQSLKAQFMEICQAPEGQRDVEALQDILNQIPVQTFMKAMLANCLSQARKAIGCLSEVGQKELLRWFDETYFE